MNLFRNLLVVAVATVGLLPALAKADEPRQVYGKWKEGNHYFYRTYNFKPTPTSDYQQHIVICYKTDRRYYYFYNPESKKFWGRCEVVQPECPTYAMLAEEDRKGNLKDIPDSAFPKPTTPPTLGEVAGLEKIGAVRDERLQLPPDEPPPSFTAGAN